jgi:histidine ammonia-lyase
MHSDPHHARALILGHDPFTIDDVVRIARQNAPLHPLPESAPPGTDLAARIERVERSAGWVQRTMDEIEHTNGRDPLVIYGVNTGFGDNAGRAVFRHQSEAAQLSRNLLLSHAIAAGDPLPADVVRATMLIRANTLAQGYSGVRREVINTLVAMLNRDVLPAMPGQGSLGASGDLAPLAHLALVLSAPVPGEDPHPGANGYAFHGGVLMDGAAAMAAAGIPRVLLGAKEGVALINGTAATCGIGALAYHDAFNTLAASEIVLLLTMEALRGYRDAVLPHVHAVRGHAGQARVASFLYRLLEGSTLVRGDAHIDLDPAQGPPQDAYSLRAAPVVLGAVLDTLEFMLADGRLNRGLPPFLIPDLPGEEGLNNGLMITQYVAASLVSENKTLAHPASVDSLPSSANREDHVSMCMIAARHAAQVVTNTQTIIAAELLCAYQALELRLQQMPDARPGIGAAAVLEYLRTVEIAPGQPLRPITRDVALKPYMDVMIEVVRSGALLDVIHAVL